MTEHETLVERVAECCWNNRFGEETDIDICRWEEAGPEARFRFRAIARAAIAATGLTEAQLEGLAAGTHVVAPVEPTDRAQKDAENKAWDAYRETMFEAHQRRAMLAAKEG